LIGKTLGSSKCKGKLDRNNVPADWLKPPPTEAVQQELEIGAKPPLSSVINSHDFEQVAEKVLTKKAWAFYSSAATDLITKEGNKKLFDRIWFRPRLVKNVKHVDTTTKILGQDVKMPFFVSPAAMAKLAHPDGELALAKGANNYGIAQCVSPLVHFIWRFLHWGVSQVCANSTIDIVERVIHNVRNHVQRSPNSPVLPALRQ
jgi:L-lactate dehydrogenase (cytochrome)